ncbi:lamb YcsF family protein [Coniophora puteana RWD-64-598 SS2]|uniref:Lamb YcsF family protein n=1 Tax=Coniophora puteana (strain RWD-64-598) TaxID=741705 RepID=A0A5M3MF12_CONPW|nr:lamb YcsF family protein [Coniophora puteana RWD-64-598 SS2]EIW77510.1 lamb YcsF family protein [Coniophora puteana RWD-64-598 SS2]
MNSTRPLKATVNCDMGEGFSLYTMGDDENLMKTIHLANIACGFHASDFSVMNKTVLLAKLNGVLVGAHPSLPDLQGFGRREMAIEPDELESCFTYQVGALDGFLKRHDLSLNHIKPHGSIYGQTARSLDLARAAVRVCTTFKGSAAHDCGVAFMGLAGTAHQQAANELGVPFIAEWFADLDYNDEGKLLITKKHDPVPEEVVRKRVRNLLDLHKVTTVGGNLLPIGEGVSEVSICCHSDTPGAVEIAQAVKAEVDASNRRGAQSMGSEP